VTSTYRPIPTDEIVAELPPEDQAKITERARELIGEHMALRDIRKARALTKEDVARSLGGKQVYVSRVERRADVKLSTLRGYVHALGGELQLLVTFPDEKTVKIAELGKTDGRPKSRGKRKTTAYRAVDVVSKRQSGR